LVYFEPKTQRCPEGVLGLGKVLVSVTVSYVFMSRRLPSLLWPRKARKEIQKGGPFFVEATVGGPTVISTSLIFLQRQVWAPRSVSAEVDKH